MILAVVWPEALRDVMRAILHELYYVASVRLAGQATKNGMPDTHFARFLEIFCLAEFQHHAQ